MKFTDLILNKTSPEPKGTCSMTDKEILQSNHTSLMGNQKNKKKRKKKKTCLGQRPNGKKIQEEKTF